MITQETAVIAGFVLFFILCFAVCVGLFVKFARLNKKLEQEEAKWLTLAESIENHSDTVSAQTADTQTSQTNDEDQASENAI